MIVPTPPDLAVSAAAPVDRRLSSSVLVVLASLAALGTLSTNIILPSFPAMGADLGMTSRDMGLTLSYFFVAFAIGQLVVGPLSDRWGRKKLVIGGLLIFAAGSVLCAYANDLTTLLTGRVVQALGVCAASVLSRAIARDLFEGEALARTLALIMVAMAAAPGFSPLLGSASESLLGWRATFGIVGGLGILAALAYASRIGETHALERRQSVSAPAMLGQYVALLNDARFARPALAVSLIVGALYAFFGAAPAVLMVGMGLSAFELGLLFAGTVIVVFASGLLAPKLAQRWGAVRVATGGILLALFGGTAVYLVQDQHNLMLFTLALTVFLAGMGTVNPLGTALTLQPFGQQAGAASALLGFLQMSCAALGTWLTSALPLPATATLGLTLAAFSLLALFAFSFARSAAPAA
ncbi:multidrug effflux MFS transporter [Halopseudomonas sabulinigri]|uniref:Bcr/CflA family efflux transporter n=1 Tax=Halopseudomonas sabulinigri TaxID=472181 RepID=A0ABP9ZM36_9GAMM